MAQVALLAAAAGYTAYSQNEAASQQRKLANRNADLIDAQATDATRRGEEEAAAVKRRARAIRGAQRASFATQGVDVNSGTANDLQEETTTLGSIDAETTRKNAFREAWGLTQSADNQRLSGRYAQQAGRNQAVGTLLGGAGDSASAYYKYKAPKVAGAGD